MKLSSYAVKSIAKAVCDDSAQNDVVLCDCCLDSTFCCCIISAGASTAILAATDRSGDEGCAGPNAAAWV
jgi:hypothetical protein